MSFFYITYFITKKLENKKVFAHSKKVIEANSVKTAKAWREAKLAEYYIKKAKFFILGIKKG